MRAWVSALAGATPRPIMVCSRARSSSDRTTMCRLRTSASCSGGIPGPHQHETEPHISQVTTDELLASIRTSGQPEAEEHAGQPDARAPELLAEPGTRCTFRSVGATPYPDVEDPCPALLRCSSPEPAVVDYSPGGNR